MKKTKIKITHQLEKTIHHFWVLDPNKLTSEEVEYIKIEMGVTMVFVNGKLYK
jgi:hypothetical protein